MKLKQHENVNEPSQKQSSKYRRGFIYFVRSRFALLPTHLLFIVCLPSLSIQVGKLRESKNQKKTKRNEKKRSKKSISIFIVEVIAQIY